MVGYLISIHALLAESDVNTADQEARKRLISIHALLAESDVSANYHIGVRKDFYPRSPCGERPMRTWKKINPNPFLSTLSLRRATWDLMGGLSCDAYFYPRSPCGERHLRVLDGSKSSIISIHALLAESDESQPPCGHPTKDFYPRSPCGERLNKRCEFNRDNGFLSTLSLRRATFTDRKRRAIVLYFYPRSPCGERRNESGEDADNGNFYPRSPCGERRIFHVRSFTSKDISIHALLAESDFGRAFWPGLSL